MICSYIVSCAGLNLQKMCRTRIEFEPPPNEPVRTQELGRIKRRGCYSPFLRHISLLTRDTFTTKQDSESIFNKFAKLHNKIDLDIWGRGEDDTSHALRIFESRF
jgi:hypothetical protein